MNKKDKKPVRKCAVCKKPFTPKVANAKYCSKECHKVGKAKLDKARKTAKKTLPLKEKIVLTKKADKKPVEAKKTKPVSVNKKVIHIEKTLTNPFETLEMGLKICTLAFDMFLGLAMKGKGKDKKVSKK